MKIHIYDGNKDLISDSRYKMPLSSESAEPPVTVRFKVKEGVNTATIVGFQDDITAVDWGLGAPLDRTPTVTQACGKEVIMYLRADNGDFREGSYITDDSLSDFLSQIEVLYNPLPDWVGSAGSYYIKIDSEKFTAPNGIFANIDILPTFREASTYEGSTFLEGPKIWADLSGFQTFPPKRASYNWQPFIDCENMFTIANQGEFGEALERIRPINLTFYDENGMGNPSAYPGGGAPKSIENYCHMTDYAIESGYAFPQFDNSRLEISIYAHSVDTLHIGKQNGLGQVSMPFGINVNDATNLKILAYKMPALSVKPGNFTGTFFYGAKVLGLEVPESVQEAYGCYEIGVCYSKEGVEPEDLDVQGNAKSSWASTPAFAATPSFIKTAISFNWGYGLDKIFEPEELLIMPKPGNHKVIDHYAYNTSEGDNSTFLVAGDKDKPNKYYQIPPLKDGLLYMKSYCRDLYRGQTIGAKTTINNYLDGLIYEIEDTITIPKLPQSLKITEYLKGTFQDTQGAGENEKVTGDAEIKTYMFYSDPGQKSEAVKYYVKTFYDPLDPYPSSDAQQIQQEYGELIAGNQELGPYLLADKILLEAGDMLSSYTTNVLRGGINIESGPLPNLQYALRWQEDCFSGATIDPTSIPTLLVPVPPSAKTENPYQRALSISKPIAPVEYKDFTVITGGRDYLGLVTKKGFESGFRNNIRYLHFMILKDPQSPEDGSVFSWTIADFHIPDIILQNQSGQNYNAFKDLFDNTWGNSDDFFNDHGVDSTITTIGARREYLNVSGLEDPGTFSARSFGFYFSWSKYKINNKLGTLHPHNYVAKPAIWAPYSPEVPPIDVQESSLEYVLKWAWISNGQDNYSQEFELTTEMEAENFSGFSKQWR